MNPCVQEIPAPAAPWRRREGGGEARAGFSRVPDRRTI